MTEAPKKRRTRPKLVKLKPPRGDGTMADTLLFLLEHVRKGKVKAFSICLVIEKADGSRTSIESASGGDDGGFELELLGCMRGAEHGLFRRREERIKREGCA